MKTRVIRIFDAVKLKDVLVVQKWCDPDPAWNLARSFPGGNTTYIPNTPAGWEPVRDFDTDEMEKALLFARYASENAHQVIEIALFENGSECRGET
jgi:hypothetical protein